MKTADGTASGTGQVIGNASADHRNSAGYVLAGPEFLTVFNGLTGAALSTVELRAGRAAPCRPGATPTATGSTGSWPAPPTWTAQRPSLIMARGYYTRAVIAAWDFRNGTLTRRWTFDSNTSGNGAVRRPGQPPAVRRRRRRRRPRRDHLRRDGHRRQRRRRCGTPATATATPLHVGDLDPEPRRPGGLQGRRGRQPSRPPGWPTPAPARSSGSTAGRRRQRPRRGRRHLGRQRRRRVLVVGGRPACATPPAATVGRKPGSTNFLAWWDGDPVRELLDGTHIDKYGTGGDTRLLTGSRRALQQRHQVHPVAVRRPPRRLARGGHLADHRQHRAAHLRHADRRPTARITTLLHDPQYRVAIAWQNTAYNQPPHPSSSSARRSRCRPSRRSRPPDLRCRKDRRHLGGGPSGSLWRPVTTETTLRYDSPADLWTDALPLGNGRLGAMVFGGVAVERLQLNDDTCWSGAPRSGSAPDGPAALAAARDALERGDVREAERQVQRLQGGFVQAYQPLVDLWLEQDAAADGYERWLRLDEGVAGQSWATGAQEAFVSRPGVRRRRAPHLVRRTAARPGHLGAPARRADRRRLPLVGHPAPAVGRPARLRGGRAGGPRPQPRDQHHRGRGGRGGHRRRRRRRPGRSPCCATRPGRRSSSRPRPTTPARPPRCTGTRTRCARRRRPPLRPPRHAGRRPCATSTSPTMPASSTGSRSTSPSTGERPAHRRAAPSARGRRPRPRAGRARVPPTGGTC